MLYFFISWCHSLIDMRTQNQHEEFLVHRDRWRHQKMNAMPQVKHRFTTKIVFVLLEKSSTLLIASRARIQKSINSRIDVSISSNQSWKGMSILDIDFFPTGKYLPWMLACLSTKPIELKVSSWTLKRSSGGVFRPWPAILVTICCISWLKACWLGLLPKRMIIFRFLSK